MYKNLTKNNLTGPRDPRYSKNNCNRPLDGDVGK